MHSSQRSQGPATLAFLLGASFIGFAGAEEVTLPTVEVTDQATRAELVPDSIKNPYRIEKSAHFGTEVMTRDDIEALNPKDVLDLLDKAVGMNMTYQGRRSPFFLDERGGGNLTYILDGAVLPTNFNRILQKIPLAAIEQVQIVRGSTSLLLGPTIPTGSSADGSGINSGFVIIRTRQPKGTDAEVSAFVEKADAQPTANGESLYVGKQLGKSDSANGYLAGMVSRRDVPSKDTWFDGQDADANMFVGGFTLDRFSMGVTAYHDDGRFEMQRGVTTTGALDPAKWYYDPLKTDLMAYNASMAWSDNQTTLLSAYNTQFNQQEYNASFANATVTSRQFEEKTSGYSIRHNVRFGDTLVQVGKQYTLSEGFGPNTNTPYSNWRTSVDGWSSAVEQTLFNGDVVLDGGYRRDTKHIDWSAALTGNPTAKQIATALKANADQDLAPATVFTLGGRWQINNMYALNGRYFDGDEGTDGDFNLATVSGAPLHAEKQKRKELALEANLVSYFRPTLTWFDVDIKNQKTASTSTYVVDGETYYYYTESDVHRRGLELLIKGDIAARSSYSVSWTHMMDNETTSSGVTADALGISSPSNIYTARVSHGWSNYRFNVSYKRVGPWSQSTSAMGTVYADLGNYDRIDANMIRDFMVDGHKEPCPMRYEPERFAYFHPGVSLSRRIYG
ncbi:TonB-dependent receptor domain-containing protein [Rhodoferax sp.]|uniref:TonB-dependent receptor plug domain-containing protein n=1 Tax=Rhodoferax sp. TaxID=50421 RepID=UPI00284AEEE5|nr:TonB-dependent receptor [Rhodoferax sp.]MDR3370321.1 TonB-dependent receptor plug domain-containing protein [Rhodoferax sp.]